MPQKPYMPLGTLRQQLLFPLSEEDAGHAVDGVSDAQLRKLASQVRLPSALRTSPRVPLCMLDLLFMPQSFASPYAAHQRDSPLAWCHSCAELADPATELSRTDNWAEIFSVGEQQRIAFLRLFRSGAALAVLDEATSAMDVATESAMYSQLAQRCRSYVSVGHRPQLTQYHTHVLTWQEPGTWHLATSPDYVAPDSAGQ